MSASGKIGVFDSGLGGLFIANAIRARLPAYDYIYLGDTLHVPYGRRSDQAIYDLSERAMRYLFDQGCELIVMACNTASAAALRKLQQGFLAREYPERRILGVVIPTLEAAIEHGAEKIGLIATQRTVHSGIYDTELRKINPAVEMTSVATPLLVPLIEDGGEKYIDAVLEDYLAPMKKNGVESIILGCTHYVCLKNSVKKIMDGKADLISQDDIIPEKLAGYLSRHPEMETRLSKDGTFDLRATDTNENFQRNARDLLGGDCTITAAVY
ncbi:MAG: glutamate racemase [Micavibrio aeruginosavorus]|uniref:Glutamate racemase n=1 Tax=Micavibrio aeruginosavorus TaxID=349221 RepID=A0A2W4ZRD9_9BACT|nr:MAG: glutamate racemase [Micavibrio aeruginosavorus]